MEEAREDLTSLRINGLTSLLIDGIELRILGIDRTASLWVKSVRNSLASLEVHWLSVLWVECANAFISSSRIDWSAGLLVDCVRSLCNDIHRQTGEGIKDRRVGLLRDRVNFSSRLGVEVLGNDLASLRDSDLTSSAVDRQFFASRVDRASSVRIELVPLNFFPCVVHHLSTYRIKISDEFFSALRVVWLSIRVDGENLASLRVDGSSSGGIERRRHRLVCSGVNLSASLWIELVRQSHSSARMYDSSVLSDRNGCSFRSLRDTSVRIELIRDSLSSCRVNGLMSNRVKCSRHLLSVLVLRNFQAVINFAVLSCGRIERATVLRVVSLTRLAHKLIRISQPRSPRYLAHIVGIKWSEGIFRVTDIGVIRRIKSRSSLVSPVSSRATSLGIVVSKVLFEPSLRVIPQVIVQRVSDDLYPLSRHIVISVISGHRVFRLRNRLFSLRIYRLAFLVERARQCLLGLWVVRLLSLLINGIRLVGLGVDDAACLRIKSVRQHFSIFTHGKSSQRTESSWVGDSSSRIERLLSFLVNRQRMLRDWVYRASTVWIISHWSKISTDGIFDSSRNRLEATRL